MRQLFGTCRDAVRPGDRDEAAAHRFCGLLERGKIEQQGPRAGLIGVPGFRSRWIMPCRCAVSSASAQQLRTAEIIFGDEDPEGTKRNSGTRRSRREGISVPNGNANSASRRDADHISICSKSGVCWAVVSGTHSANSYRTEQPNCSRRELPALIFFSTPSS